MIQPPRAGPTATQYGSDVDDPSIPLLTDRIFLPALELDIAVPLAQAPAAPALQPSAYAAVAARTADYAAVEVIGSVELPLVTLGEAEAENEAAAGTGEASQHDLGPPPEAEAEIETELDRDLIAELDADFNALLSAEADLDRASTAASVSAAPDVEADRPDDAAPTSSAARAVAFGPTEAVATAESAAEASGEAQFEPSADPPAQTPAPPDDDGAATPAADAPVEASAEIPAEPSANFADDVAPLDEGHDVAAPAAESIAPLPEEPVPAAPRPDQLALAAEAQGLRTAVLDSVAQRLPAHIDTTVRELMQPALDEALARLGDEAKVALRISLQQLVEQVLREELDRRLADREPPAR